MYSLYEILVYGGNQDLQFEVSQVSPSYSPSPVVAHAGCTYQLRSRIRVKPSFSCISCGFMAETRTVQYYLSLIIIALTCFSMMNTYTFIL